MILGSGEWELFEINVSAKLQKSLTVVYSMYNCAAKGCKAPSRRGVRHIINKEGRTRSFSPVASRAPATMRGGEKSVLGVPSRA